MTSDAEHTRAQAAQRSCFNRKKRPMGFDPDMSARWPVMYDPRCSHPWWPMLSSAGRTQPNSSTSSFSNLQNFSKLQTLRLAPPWSDPATFVRHDSGGAQRNDRSNKFTAADDDAGIVTTAVPGASASKKLCQTPCRVFRLCRPHDG
jgi:hypothetical protein